MTMHASSSEIMSRAVRWMLADLDNMLLCSVGVWQQADKIGSRRPDGALNFPIATCVFSYIDFLGSTFPGMQGDGHTGERIKKFICDYFPGRYKAHADDLYEHFRNGCVHGYFPKGNRGVVSQPGVEGCHLRDGQIHVRPLVQDFREAVQKYLGQYGTDPAVRQGAATVIRESLEGGKVGRKAARRGE